MPSTILLNMSCVLMAYARFSTTEKEVRQVKQEVYSEICCNLGGGANYIPPQLLVPLFIYLLHLLKRFECYLCS